MYKTIFISIIECNGVHIWLVGKLTNHSDELHYSYSMFATIYSKFSYICIYLSYKASYASYPFLNIPTKNFYY